MHYKLRIKGKVEQSRKRNPPLHIDVVPIEKGAFASTSTKVANFIFNLRSLNVKNSSISNNSV